MFNALGVDQRGHFWNVKQLQILLNGRLVFKEHNSMWIFMKVGVQDQPSCTLPAEGRPHKKKAEAQKQILVSQ